MGIARRLKSKRIWSDLALPKTETDQLRQIAVRAAQHNTFYRKSNTEPGIRALFAGGSGPEETMAAEVIAAELKLPLYRIDLSQVVSKYIGETEKNLRRVFDDAEASGAVLFFDEADALFGKRSEVKDSHDRYANIEIDYLLQRIESYCGLVIFATERKAALDPAFIRRLRYVVDFRLPAPRPVAKARLKRTKSSAAPALRPQKRRPRNKP